MHGKIGRNISCDLHMEHLNRLLTTCISTLGINKTPTAIVRLGKCIGPMSVTLDAFDSEHAVKSDSGSHKRAKVEKDLKLLVNELYSKAHVFENSPGGKLNAFPNVKHSILTKGDKHGKAQLSIWMKEKWRKLVIGLL